MLEWLDASRTKPLPSEVIESLDGRPYSQEHAVQGGWLERAIE